MLFARGMNVELLLIGGLIGLIIAVGLTVLYFPLAKFFAANARALDRNQKAAEQMARETHQEHPARSSGRLDELGALQKAEIKSAAKAGK
jgi:uncharacterized membrane protein YccC